MKNYPSPDSFIDIVVTQHEDDFTTWRVVGVSVDWDAVKQRDIETGFANRALAEAFFARYTSEYIEENFFKKGPSE
ncbi:hypothetical protein SEA_FAUST_145 [Streptomyces phage Faust]|uniref:Uncharacterized protein n=1 Tax=Streptomyces phage Faust TaxID=2767565 RepID=A0A7G9UYX2_9CAUD|nr:hypothetical protein PP456_gp132 [Streptomyces phage Faust]QNN99227.1 hypothetical protein SEA_FAUST_145 [Streptomyces phage Faust]